MAKGGDPFESRYERMREVKKNQKKNAPGEDEEPLPPPPETIKKEDEDVGRNDPCPCGSGKKYKQCCLKNKDQKKKGWFS